MNSLPFKSFALALSFVVASASSLLVGCGSRQNAETPRVGGTAPNFMLQDQTGRVRTLAEYRRRPVVLYFYPRDNTPGCTREACAFRDAWSRLQEQGAVVLGVSTDDVESHRRFQAEHNLPFDLLSDPEEKAAQAYGVPVRMSFAAHGLSCRRCIWPSGMRWRLSDFPKRPLRICTTII